MDCSSGVSTMMSVERDTGVRRTHGHAIFKEDHRTLAGEGPHRPLRSFLFLFLPVRKFRPRQGGSFD